MIFLQYYDPMYGAGGGGPSPNGGVPPPFVSAGPVSNGGASPPRGPCYAPAPGHPETAIVYTGPPPLFHAATIDPTTGAPGPIYASHEGTFDSVALHTMAHLGPLSSSPYGLNEVRIVTGEL